MKTITVKLASVSAYSQSRHYSEVEVPRLNKEKNDEYERRTWRNRLHKNEEGYVVMPIMSFKNCISEAAKFLSLRITGSGKATYTKHVEAGVMVDPSHPVILPVKVENVIGEPFFVPSDGIRGSGKRVEKIFPMIPNWKADISLFVFDETVLNTEEVTENSKTVRKIALQYIIEQAGLFIGLGRFRPRNNGFYGRFGVERFEVE
jgi:hypothetical protein